LVRDELFWSLTGGENILAPMRRLGVRSLGGLAIEGVDRSALGARKQRRLLARLAVARGAAVSVGELAEDLWGDAQPASPRDPVAVLASRLRSALPEGCITWRHGGYALDVVVRPSSRSGPDGPAVVIRSGRGAERSYEYRRPARVRTRVPLGQWASR
jgi:hypothetical protein